MTLPSITLHDVAREAGVSLITASRALSNPGRVAEATAIRIQAVAAQLGYVPNLLAGGLKTRRSRTVAALVPIISVPQFLPTINALTVALDREGYQLILGQIGYDRARERDLLDAMVGRRVDGIVVAGTLSDSPASRRLRQAGIPLVETWDLADAPMDMVVGFSQERVGRAVGAYFLARGWRRIGIATGDDPRARARSESFRAVVAGVGASLPTAVVPAPSNMASGRRACAQLLDAHPDLDAIFCSSDMLAEGVLTEARVRGIRVPHDLAVCGFGGADFAAHLAPSLTTVQVDGARIGEEAARLVFARIGGQAVQDAVIDVGFQIVERESTRLSDERVVVPG